MAPVTPSVGGPSGPGSPAGAAVPAPKGLVLAACCTALVITGTDTTIVNSALPSIGRALGTGTSGLQWVIACYTVPLAGLLLASGSVGDRIGRRALFLVALAVFCAGSWGCSIAPTLGWLLTARTVQGCGASGLAPAALGIITSLYPEARSRSRALGVWDACLGAGMAAGPAAGGVLVASCGWQSVFWVNVPASLAAAAAVALIVPEARSTVRRRVDLTGQVLALLATGTLAAGIIDGPALGWTSPGTAGLLGLSAASVTGLAAVSRRRPDPLVDLRMLRPGPVSAGLAGGLLASAVLAGWLFLTALYLQDARGYGPAAAGLVILPMPLAMTAGSVTGGRLVSRAGPGLLFAAGGTWMGAACYLQYGLAAEAPVTVVSGAGVLFGGGLGLASAAVTCSIMRDAGDKASVLSGMNSSARQLGATIGVAVTGTVLAATVSAPGQAVSFTRGAAGSWWLLTALSAAVAALGIAAWPRPKKETPAARGGTL